MDSEVGEKINQFCLLYVFTMDPYDSNASTQNKIACHMNRVIGLSEVLTLKQLIDTDVQQEFQDEESLKEWQAKGQNKKFKTLKMAEIELAMSKVSGTIAENKTYWFDLSKETKCEKRKKLALEQIVKLQEILVFWLLVMLKAAKNWQSRSYKKFKLELQKYNVLLVLLILKKKIQPVNVENKKFEWSCGSSEFSTKLALTSMKLGCMFKRDSFNECCKEHDACYDNQVGRNHCDSVFCNCLKKAAEDILLCRKVHAFTFCTLVKAVGIWAYKGAAPSTKKNNKAIDFYKIEQ
uniref:Phospholipase A(2) n=1 Tax=Ditylenchus dipsaci TaxID=166011 RepID=A0A915CQ19_9BILA